MSGTRGAITDDWQLALADAAGDDGGARDYTYYFHLGHVQLSPWEVTYKELELPTRPRMTVVADELSLEAWPSLMSWTHLMT